MSKAKKIIFTVLAVVFGLLVLSNCFMIWQLGEVARTYHGVTDLRPQIRMDILLNNDTNKLATEDYKLDVAAIMEEDPGIITREPIIFIANPGLKPIVAEILAEDPSILEDCLKIVTRNPDLLELNPELKETVKDYLEKHYSQEIIERDFHMLLKYFE
ncbi:MAG: hypothetical protein K2N38_10305 [Oscillospiraceae bacterium]|nr:hypothetical protein [Oscillospiraceae bacterium]